MKIVSHKKELISGINPAHVEPPPIPLIKEICNGNSDEDLFKLKLCRDPTSSTSDLNEYHICLCLAMASQKGFCFFLATST